MVLRRNRRRIVAFGERNHDVRLPGLACRDELVEFGNEGIAVRGAEAGDGGVVEALAVAGVLGGGDAALDAEVRDQGLVDGAVGEGGWGGGDGCEKREEAEGVLHNECGCDE